MRFQTLKAPVPGPAAPPACGMTPDISAVGMARVRTTVRAALVTTLAAAALSVGASGAWAQAWPTKPVRIIVPYTPGGSSDIIARAIQPMLSEALKQPIIIDNKPGASGNLGADAVAKATDDHTLLMCDVTALAISPSLYTKLAFDPSKDLKGVAMLAYSPHLLVVHPSVPANNLKELVALSKTSKIDFAVTAMGSAPHLAGFAVAAATGAKWEYIPYKGGSQAVTDTIAGQTQVLMNGMLATLPFVQNGKLKVLGVSKSTRVPLLPHVPTIAEQGAPGFESGTWQGILAPASLPPAAVSKLSAELIRIIRSPDLRARLASQGAEVNTMNPTEFNTFFAKERQSWAAVVSKSGIKLD
jgi:tripartite-type tricarboxylate transporter receptor subunit TctC